jgi:class 3 adenylate cyclase
MTDAKVDPGAAARTVLDRRVATFVFADLAGYTALTEAHGDEHAADVAEGFCRRVRALLQTYGAG